MSVTPAEETIDLVQGSTLDETFEYFDGPGETNPTDFTGVVAQWRFAKDSETPPFLTLTSVGKTTGALAIPTDGDGVYLLPGLLRLYVRNATLAALTETQFRRGGCDDGAGYLGLNTLLFTKAGVTTVENVGEVTFTPIVEPAP